jgi:uncharacterized protein (TIGR03435 family)
MTRHLLIFVIFVVAAATLAAQAGPTFEVASIRASADQGQAQVAAGVQITQRQVRFSALTLRDYVGIAYGVRARQVTGPDWISTTRFEIAATMPEGSNSEQLDDMLKALLIERFKLQAHKESREFPVYALEVAASGLKLVKIVEDPAAVPAAGAPLTVAGSGSARGIAVDLGGGSSYAFGNNRLEGKKLTMAALAETLTGFVDRPVVDMTKTEGRFDVSFDVSPEDFQGMMIRAAVSAGIVLPAPALRLLDTAGIGSLLDSMDKAGLSMPGRRAPLDFIVVDSIDKAPTEN